MNISFRSRRRRVAVGGAVLALSLGGFAAALPAQASATSPKTPIGISYIPEVSDSLNPGGVTSPDAILTCATSAIMVGTTPSLAIPVGCLTLYNGEWVKVSWASEEPGWELGSMELTQQTDGNLVFYVTNKAGVAGSPITAAQWASGTEYPSDPAGPGCFAQFQSSAGLVVDDCNGTSIWNSGSHSYSSTVLAIQYSGDLVIYQPSTGTTLWSS